MTSKGADDVVGRFLALFLGLEPVTASFAGFDAFDARLPDWSPAGLESAAAEMRALRSDLAAADRALADACLEISLAEQSSAHFQRGNPALWTGEAVFSALALALRPPEPDDDRRMREVELRLREVPRFLGDATKTLGITEGIPQAWVERALRECTGADLFLGNGIDAWISGSMTVDERIAVTLRASAHAARAAFAEFANWLRGVSPAPPDRYGCGEEMLDLMLRRGHWCSESRAALLTEARDSLAQAEARLGDMARAVAPGGWPEVQQRLADDRPDADEYMDTFAREWDACREFAEREDLVTWADMALQFAPVPEFARAAAPHLYFLNYRSPAPHDPPAVHRHFVPPPAAASRSVIRLNHVIHHAALGHHVQNAHARSAFGIGKFAAVDGASRIAMVCGGTVAEGWACYAVDLAEEFGYLTPLECVSQQHTRVRILCRAVADLSLHSGAMTLDEIAAFYAERALLAPAAARGEAVKNSMFPGAAVMYWLGTRGIHALRADRARVLGESFSLRRFHDDLLSHGAIPVPMIAALMSAPSAA